MIKNKNNYRIAIIEDNEGDFTLISDYLAEQISEPVITHLRSFKQAKEILLDEKPFDVILLDLTLPDSKGEKLITDIIAISAGCPVIILTGYADIEFSIKSLSLGVADYLLKDDINATSLYKSIIYCIKRRHELLKLQESEKRYSNLFGSTPQPMWLYDPATLQFVQVNKAAIDHYGYSEEEFLNGTLLMIRPDTELHKLKHVMHNMHADDNEKQYKGKYVHRKKSNELIDVEIYSSPVMLNGKKYRLAIAVDVTAKTSLERKLLQQKVEEQKKITIAVVNAQEKERSEIGLELHDNVNQLLAASKLYLNHCLSMPEDCKDYIVKTQEYISNAMDELRKLSHALIGPAKNKTVGLIDSLSKLVNDIAVLQHINIQFSYCQQQEDEIEEEIENELKLIIYRIAQEQINNILKHANASNVDVILTKKCSMLEVIIRDNGKGFNLAQKNNGIGLTNIKNRAEIYNGKVHITTSPGNGCTMKINFTTTAKFTINFARI